MRLHRILCVALVSWLSFLGSALATTYYLKADGNDKLDGKSDATAWKTISKVNSFSFNAGDDVFFKCGGVWTGTQLRINWNGTSSNRVIVGAYHMDDGKAIHGVSGAKPVIDGNHAIPSNEYTGLIQINANYIQVENFHVRNSEGMGVYSASRSNLYIYDIDTYDTLRSGVRLKTCNTGEIKRCTIDRACMNWPENGGSSATGWGGVLEIVGSSGFTVSHNTVHDSYGEGIITDRFNDNILIEYNTVYGNRAAQIYVDSSDSVTVRYNLVYGVADSPVCDRYSSGRCGPGIWVNWENWESADDGHMDNIKVYGNVVANTVVGMYITTQHDEIDLRYSRFYNNTVVDCGSNVLLTNGPYVNCEFKNNISYCASSDCSVGRWNTPSSGMTVDYNLWSSAPDTALRGKNDVTPYQAPKIAKTSGWRNIKAGGLKGPEFALQPGSPAIAAGIPLADEYSKVLRCALSDWPAGQFVSLTPADQSFKWCMGADAYSPLAELLSPPSFLEIVSQ